MKRNCEKHISWVPDYCPYCEKEKAERQKERKRLFQEVALRKIAKGEYCFSACENLTDRVLEDSEKFAKEEE